MPRQRVERALLVIQANALGAGALRPPVETQAIAAASSSKIASGVQSQALRPQSLTLRRSSKAMRVYSFNTGRR